MGEKISLTKEQQVFFLCMKKLKALEEETNISEINKIRFFLWEKIKLFARKEMYRMAGNYTTAEERMDIEQDMALIFFEKLPFYDPLRTTPTTYFVRYFREQISKYLRNNKIHMTQYDANNARKISAAIAEYNQKGIQYTLDMLSTKTGLTQKVIRSTIQFSANAKQANVEEAYSLCSKELTPEERVEKKEREETLYKAIMRNTNNDELQLLSLRININGKKEMPFDKISECTGIPIREVKSTINRVICRLNQDKELRKQFRNYNPYSCVVKPIAIQESAAEIMQEQLIGSILIKEEKKRD